MRKNSFRRIRALITFICITIFATIIFSCSNMLSDLKKAANSQKTYSVVFNLNGGTWATGYTGPTTYTVGSGLILPAGIDLVRSGYSFDGWFDNQELTGNSITQIARILMNGEIFQQ